MQPRVTAILVARNGQKHLERTLDALTKQTRQPDVIITVDCGSTDATGELLAVFGPTHLLAAETDLTFGEAINAAVRVTPSPSSDNEMLWFLAQDSAPHPEALAALLGELEIAPSVAVAGPKVMEWVADDYIHDFGESVTPSGATVTLVENELDQGQYDGMSDVLGVSAGGMLVRHAVWEKLGGFDPALPVVDDALDFCIRVRLAGWRVSVASTARVATAEDGVAGPNGSSRGKPRRRRMRAERSAQLHRRLVYSPAWALPFHWLTLVPLAILRSIGQLLRKEPGAIIGEFAAAFGAAFAPMRLGNSRRRLAETRTVGWASLASLRVPSAVVRRRHALKREATITAARGEKPDLDFFSGGGGWVVVIAACVGLGVLSPLLGAQTLAGGGLLPLSGTLGELWNNVAYGWRDIGLGFVGAADPFTAVLAVLGSLTFWSPSFALVLLYFIALPAAALGAWAAAARLTRRNGLRAVAAVLWFLAPPFLTALAEGRPAAIIVHLLLPWLVVAGVGAVRSWSASASAALLFAAIVACAPSLAPALLIGWLICVVISGRRIMRFIGIPLPALALAAPLIWDQGLRANWVGLLADPGAPVAHLNPSVWQLLLGFPSGEFGGWNSILQDLGLSGVNAELIVPIVLAPLAVLAIVALFLRGSRGASFALLTALLGLGTAVAANQVFVTSAGEIPVSLWSGSGLSLYWLGLVGAAVFALRGLGRFALAPAIVLTLLLAIVAVPLAAAQSLGTSAVAKGIGRTLPAFVGAEAGIDPRVSTLELIAQPDGAMFATIVRGADVTLDSQSTLANTDLTLSSEDREFATLVGNLTSRSGLDTATPLIDHGIRFVLLRPAAVAPGAPGTTEPTTPPAAETQRRALTSLDGNSALVPVGATNFGELWQVADAADATAHETVANPGDSLIRKLSLLVIVIVFGATLLLSIPTGAGREAVREANRDAIRRQAKAAAKAARRQKRDKAPAAVQTQPASSDAVPTDAVPADAVPSTPLEGADLALEPGPALDSPDSAAHPDPDSSERTNLMENDNAH